MEEGATAKGAPPVLRRLVTCRRITSTDQTVCRPYELLSLDGWTVIARRGQFATGQLVVFFEIDSFLPASDGRFWEYMCRHRDSLDGREGYRVKSHTINGSLSQGIVMPVETFPEINTILVGLKSQKPEADAVRDMLTMSFDNLLGVRKWEVRVDDTADLSLGKPPTFIRQPACERIQNVSNLQSITRLTFQVSEKLDGLSMTVYAIHTDSHWHRGLSQLPPGSGESMNNRDRRIGVCSRHKDFIDNGQSLFWNVAKAMDLPSKVAKISQSMNKNLALQGEICGSTIENNMLNFPEGEHAFFAFGIWDIDKQCHFGSAQTEDICKSFDIPHAPILCYRRLNMEHDLVRKLIEEADGVGINGSVREGYVFKSVTGKVHFKVISNKWLTKTGK